MARTHHAVHAMGTRFEFVLEGEDERTIADVAHEAGREVESLHARLSAFEKSSELCSLARRAIAGPVRAERDLFTLLETCELVRTATAGAFDVCHASGTAMRLDPAARTLSLEGAPVGDRCPIDLGAVAKGFALERCAEIAREFSVEHAFLHAGTSSVLVLGSPTATVRVRLAHGHASLTHFPGMRLSVSATRERAHIADPRTGRSAAGVRTTFVIGTDGVLAEAWSTALVVLGERPASCPTGLTTGIERADGTVEISGPLRDTVHVETRERMETTHA